MVATDPRTGDPEGRPTRCSPSPLSRRLHLVWARALVAVIAGLALATPAASQWDPWEGALGEQQMPGARRGARFVPELGESRQPFSIPRPVPLPAPFTPRTAQDLHPREYQALTRSYALAVETVKASPACQALFAELGADGGSVLAKAFFLRAKPEHSTICTNGVVAFTHVRDHRCWICPRFGGLSTSAGAMILIHEALHMAGMPEDPEPNGLQSSFGINRLVHRTCMAH